MKKYQVVFFGTSEFAIPALDSLLKSHEIEVKAVVTQPDKPTGRHQELTPPPVKLFLEKGGESDIPVLQPETLRKNTNFRELIEDLEPDIFVVVSYGHIIPKSLLNVAKYGAVNIHGSLLPKYRGASPIQQALLQGDTTTGITIMKLSEKMDEGPVIFLKRMPIEENDTFETLYKKLAILGGEFIVPAMLDYIDETLQPIPQDHSRATYCEKIEKNDGLIDWENMTAQEIHNRVRAFTPWPGCFTYWQGKRLKLIEVETRNGTQKPGTMKITAGTDGQQELHIGTKEGLIAPTKLQLEGKSVMDLKTFLNGYGAKIQTSDMVSLKA